MGFEWVGREQQRLNSKMRLSLVSSVLVASMVQAAPGASSYGGPAKQIASTPSIQCRTEYVTLWDTEYQEREEQVCETVYEKQCETRTQRLCQPTTRQECTTNYVKECSTIYKNVCVQKFRTEYEPYTESECTTEYKRDCQDPCQASCLSGVQRRPRAEVCLSSQAGLHHRSRPSVHQRATHGMPGRSSPILPLGAQEVPGESEQAGAQEGLRRGARSSRCRTPSRPPSHSLGPRPPQLWRPCRPHPDCARDHPCKRQAEASECRQR